MNINTQKTLGLLMTFGLLAMLPGVAQAQCGSILTTNTVLSGNLVCGSGNGLELAASNITLDCAGFTISGSGSGIGILLDNVSQSAVINCSVDNFAVGFRVDGGSNNRLSRNIALLNQSTSGGFNLINGSVGNTLDNNASGFNVGRGFSFNNSDGNMLFYNEAFNNNFRGFDIINSDSNYLHGNAAVNNLSAGMVVQNYLGGTSTGNVLDKNYIEGSGSEGLAMFATGNTVQFLVSDNNGTYGIRDPSGGPNTYTGNSCSGNTLGASLPISLC